MSMTAMKKISPSLDSFEETYKTAYSHGLESIYALETVDLKTVRPIQPLAEEDTRPHPVKEAEVSLKQQLEFDFGPSFRLWITPIFLKEPLSSLGLSLRAEKILKELNITTFEQLAKANLQQMAVEKGIGQGHVDEVQAKMKEFLRGRSLKESQLVEVGAWVRALLGAVDKKKGAVFLKNYGLEKLVSLSIAGQVEVRTAEGKVREEWLEEVNQILRMPQTKSETDRLVSSIAHALVIPWINARGGVADMAEVDERLEKIADQSEYFPRLMALLSDTFFAGRFPFDCHLPMPEEGVYCSSEEAVRDYLDIKKVAISYFYHGGVKYPLQQLVRLVADEFGRSWRGFPEGFLERVLRCCPAFNVRRKHGIGHEVVLV